MDKRHRIYRQRPVHRLGLPAPTGAGEGAIHRVLQQHERLRGSANVMPSQASVAAMSGQAGDGNQSSAPVTPAHELHFRLLGRFGPASLLVTAEREIIHLSENASRFLQLPEGEPTRNLLRLVHPMLRVDLRAALLRSAETGGPIEIHRRLVEMPTGTKVVDVKVLPAGEMGQGQMLVLFDERDANEAESATQTVQTSALDPAAVVQQLERELNRANANLRGTVEQYEASTEELKASNEELQAMNEELRSAGEELETGREELQSVNEELTTVNAEFKNRVEELARANSDLHNLMSATQIATVFLGRELQILRYTPSAAPLFNLIPGDVGRPIAHLKQRIEYPEMAADAEKVLRTLVPVERELRGDGRWFLARVQPYRTIEDQIAGLVLTFVDITEARSAIAELQARNAELEKINQEGAGRELLLAELKRELNAVLAQQGLPPKYP